MNINQPLAGKGLALPFTKAANPNAQMQHEDMRLPLVHKIPDSLRNHFVAMCGEFVGTFLFLFFALSGTQVANSINTSSGESIEQVGSNPQQLQYIALCFGFSLAVNAWVFFRISGGLFNPAVSFGMCLIGALPWVRGTLLFITQILGGIAAAALVSALFPGDLLCRTTLGGGTSIAQGLFIEMFLTAQLIFTIFMLAAEKHKGTFIAPVGIGLSLFIAELTGVYFTGGSLNPARSFGPDVVVPSFEGYHWIYWVGPILGAIVAAGFYKFIKILEYETANPDQDTDHATNVANTKDLLVAAGINEYDANHVAKELVESRRANANGAPDPTIVANGQGQAEVRHDPNGMYGTQFRAGGEKPANGAPADGGNGSIEASAPQNSRPSPTPQNSGGVPDSIASARQPGHYSYLGKTGSNPPEPRVDSPAMATQDSIYNPLSHGTNPRLGGLFNSTPRQGFARSSSGGV